MKREELQSFLLTLGIPGEKTPAMAEQLENRAQQLCVKRGETYEVTLAYLIDLLKQGWAAKRDK